MTVEYAPVRAVHKPWGSMGLRPWRAMWDSDLVGELWFECPGAPASDLLRNFSQDSDAQLVSVQSTGP